MLRVAYRVENILPAPLRLVLLPSSERDPRDEVVRNVSVLVERDFASLPLGEERVRDSRELSALDTLVPVTIRLDAEVLELHVDLGPSVDGVSVVV